MHLLNGSMSFMVGGGSTGHLAMHKKISKDYRPNPPHTPFTVHTYMLHESIIVIILIYLIKTYKNKMLTKMKTVVE